MDSQEYYIGFYSIFAGVAGTGLVINWVKILKDYPVKKVSWYQLLWSFQFFMLLAWEWYWPKGANITSPGELIQILISPIILYAICYLFLPQTDEEYYHPLENQKVKIALLGLAWCINKYVEYYINHDGSLLGWPQIQMMLSLTMFLILAIDKSRFTWAAGSIVDLIYLLIIYSFPWIGFFYAFFVSVIFMSCIFIIYFLNRIKKRVLRKA